MIIIGIILLLLGFLLGIYLLWVLGVICLVLGLVLFALGHFRGPVGGRRHWWWRPTPGPVMWCVLRMASTTRPRTRTAQAAGAGCR
jgi:hypothetical protein